jgi:hypothetical protein
LEHFGKFRKILSPIRCFTAAADHPDRRWDCSSDRGIEMNTKMLARFFALSGAAMCLGAVPVLADGEHCRQVGGGVLTNFLDPSQCLPTSNSKVARCTDGTATGDLKGAVGVQVAGITGNVYHNHHHWVTESGDTIFLNPADLTLYLPTPDPNNRVLADYLQGVEITGGTGAFDGATGTIFAFGAADLNLGQITLRYAGTLCFNPVPPP